MCATPEDCRKINNSDVSSMSVLRGTVCLFAALFLVPAVSESAARSKTKPAIPPPLKLKEQHAPQAFERFRDRLPLVFEPNLGQTGPQVRFLTRAAGITAFLTDRENVMVLSRRKNKPDARGRHAAPESEQTAVRMKLEGARAPVAFEGLEKAESYSNYFIGNDPSKWVTDVPHYRKVRAREVYAGIDLIYYGDAGELEYDFVVRPGADPSLIHLAYEGADTLKTDKQGNLLIATRIGTLVQRRPLVYQEVDGQRREVRASYSIRGQRVELALSAWDRQRELIIDPVLYASYIGGSIFDYGYAVAVDGGGAIYLTGDTASADFPNSFGQTKSGQYDVFIAKINPQGQGANDLVYSTFVGGDDYDTGTGIKTDLSGAAYVSGSTYSSNFPVTPNAFQTVRGNPSGASYDVFVLKIGAAGNQIAYATYLGGDKTDTPNGMAVDSNGAVYVTGYTTSTNFPTRNAYLSTFAGASAGYFVAKLNPAGGGDSDLLYSTFLAPDTRISAIAVGVDGAAYLTGDTGAVLPVTPGAPQPAFAGVYSNAFVAKLDPGRSGTASLIYSTYLGGHSTPEGVDGTTGLGIAVNSAGEAYVTGTTATRDFPTVPGSYQTVFVNYDPYASSAFVTKINAQGTAFVYSTFVRQSDYTTGGSIEVDATGAVYLFGSGNPFLGSCATDSYSYFLLKLNSEGRQALSWEGPALAGRLAGMALDSSGLVYFAGTADGGFPVTAGAYQTAPKKYDDAAFLKVQLIPLVPVSMTRQSGDVQSAIVGAAFASELQAKVTDAGGNAIGGLRVGFDVPASGPSATLSATSAITDCSGIARVTATANSVTGSYTVTASVTDAAPSTAFSLTNTAGAPAQIAFVQRPVDTQAGQVINPPVTVSLKDASNNPIGGTAATLSVLGGGATLIGMMPQTTDSSGIATFSDLKITTAGTYQLQATGGSLTATSASFMIAAGSAISITPAGGTGQSEPSSALFPAPLKAIVKDAYQNPISGASVTFTAPASGANVTFAGSNVVTTGADGIATSPSMTASAQAGSFQVTATTSGAPSPAAFSLTVIAGAANKLVFAQQPSDAAAGDSIAPALTVQVQDSAGNPVGAAGRPVTLQLLPGGTLFGAPTQNTNANGLATFPGLSVQRAGQYRLLAESSGISSPTSSPFTIRAGSAINAVLSGTPQSAMVLAPFVQPLQARITDSYDNPVSGLTLTFEPPPSGPSATLSTPAATTDANGNVSVTATANNVIGTYSVSFFVGNAAFGYSLTNTTASPGQINFTQQPGNAFAGATISPPVGVLLTNGIGVPVSGATVTLSIVGGTAALNGTVTGTTNDTGHATFPDLSVNKSGTYNLLAVSGILSGVSAPFSITASKDNTVVITVYDGDGQSAPLGSAYGAPLKALVTDNFSNPLSDASVTFTAPESGAGVSFSGPATVTTDASGIATSPPMTANGTAGNFAVTAATTGAGSDASFTLTNVQATANKLAFTQQPTDTLAGATITPPVTIQLQDSSGNPLSTGGVAVTLQSNLLARRLGSLSGTVTKNTDGSGLATFDNLSVAHAGSYQLLASASGAGTATSNSFRITAGTPTAILASGGTPQSAIISTTFGAPLQATITDSSGNPVGGVQVVFTAPTTDASGVFGGQSTITTATDAQGHATAVVTANGITGTYGVTATAAMVTGSALFTLTNLPQGASSLTFGQQPGNTAAGQVIAPPVTVRLQSASGQLMAAGGVPVVLSLSSGSGTLFGTVVQLTDGTGLATFNDLRIGQTGAKRLRATSPQQAPAESNSFEITAGTATSITALSGAPQAALVNTLFGSLLQARLSDVAGNPIPGVTVTFTAPASGPSGAFATPATMTTNGDGVATAPVLTANGEPGNFVVTASAAGVTSPAVFALTNLPQQTSGISVNPSTLRFVSEINQSAPPGQTVQITSTNAAASWTATSSAAWLSALPASGTAPGQTTVTVNPAGLAAAAYTGNIRIVGADGSVGLVLVTLTVSDKPALVVTPPTLVFTTTNNTVTPAANTLQVTSSSRAISYTVSAQVSTPQGGSWLRVSPAQGQTTGTVNVSVNPDGLANGVYDGSVLLTPTEGGINQVAAPVTLIIGCAQGGCQLQPTILSVVNGASFHPGGSPAAIVTIFGTQLSDNVYQAAQYPLPTQLGPTTVTINGQLVPLFYVSPTQINFQMPSSAPVTAVTVTANNASVTSPRALSASPSRLTTLEVTDPGLFVTPDKRAAALNGDLTPHTAATPIPAGGYVILYMTGSGPVTPPLADGTAAPSSPLSIINATVQVTIGGKLAQVTYQGAAPGFAGLEQLNVIVPSGLTPGDQPVFLTINGQPSNAGVITVR
jgi:uncharacterized protein (TIGR03437 family)